MTGLCQDSWTRAHSLSRIKPPDRSLLPVRPQRDASQPAARPLHNTIPAI